MLRPRAGQKEPPRLGSTICYVGQKEPPRLGSTICYGQELARRSHQDSAVRPCYGQTWARKSHQDSAVRLVTVKRGPERATKIRQYDLLRPKIDQKEPPRLGSTICYGQELARRSSPRLDSTICYGQTWARKRHQDSAVRFVTAKSWPEGATKTRQFDLLRPNVGQNKSPRLGSTICLRPRAGQKEPPRLCSTICYDQKIDQKEPPRLGSTICYGQELARKSHQDSAVRFVAAERGPERATKTRQYDLLRPNVGQKEPPRLGSTVCCGQELARKSHQDSAVRFVTAKSWPESATKTRRSGAGRGRAGGGRRERGAAGGRQRGGRKVERAAEIETRTRATGDQATTAQKHARVGEKFEMQQPAPERLKRRRVQGSSNQYPKG